MNSLFYQMSIFKICGLNRSTTELENLANKSVNRTNEKRINDIQAHISSDF